MFTLLIYLVSIGLLSWLIPIAIYTHETQYFAWAGLVILLWWQPWRQPPIKPNEVIMRILFALLMMAGLTLLAIWKDVLLLLSLVVELIVFLIIEQFRRRALTKIP